jgi:hypothetical protein
MMMLHTVAPKSSSLAVCEVASQPPALSEICLCLALDCLVPWIQLQCKCLTMYAKVFDEAGKGLCGLTMNPLAQLRLGLWA